MVKDGSDIKNWINSRAIAPRGVADSFLEFCAATH
jgi:hypothetical protein